MKTAPVRVWTGAVVGLLVFCGSGRKGVIQFIPQRLGFQNFYLIGILQGKESQTGQRDPHGNGGFSVDRCGELGLTAKKVDQSIE